MRGPVLSALFVGALGLAPCALAQDTDEFTFEDEGDDPFFEEDLPEEQSEEEEPPAKGEAPAEPAPPPSPDEPDLLEDEDDLLFEDELSEEGDVVEDDLFADEADTRDEVLAEGADNATLFRQQQERVEGLALDEEVMAWEDYLQTYPNSLYRERVEARIDELLTAQYGQRIRREGSGDDADKQELLFNQPMHMANVNPRTKVQLGFEYGFPSFVGGVADFEYAVLRNLSVHGGFTGRYAGWGLEFGTRYAFVKSTKHQLVATLIADFRVNFNPVFFQMRPMLGIGKIAGPVQILVTAGAEIGTRFKNEETVGVIGGGHVSVRVAPPIAVFAETDFTLRNFGHTTPDGAGKPFAFVTATLGFRFYPALKNRNDDPLEIGAAGNVPAATQYLQEYQGSAHVLGTFYPQIGKR